MNRNYSSPDFEKKFTYRGEDLGASWTEAWTAFRLWAPTAEQVQVRLYASGDPRAEDLLEEISLAPGENGTWTGKKTGNLQGIYYTYAVLVDGAVREVCDPYARATGVNGKRAMVLNPASVDPPGWAEDRNPHAGEPITDAVIYELHIRDLSMDPESGIVHRGKFLGLTETGTVNGQGSGTGLDYIRSLGITHLQLLPCFDFGSVDERKDGFNWGYDPVNYNVPEGSYSTDPYRGEVRIAEMKQMVKTLHDNGISVVMDVVYNHVFQRQQFCVNEIVPDFFSRVDRNGKDSNGSGCGNDTASERPMVRKYIVDSVNYWADAYHIDGFRFDLAGLLDVDTIREIIRTVRQKHPGVLFYGEGWSMDTVLTKPHCRMTTQCNADLAPEFAFFNDTLRDGLRGSVFDNYAAGFLGAVPGLEPVIRDCWMGKASWCPSPAQTINYASCHDNMTLWDRLAQSLPEASEADRLRMNRLSAAICLTAQGIPFFQAGEELLRSKPLEDGSFDSNSYKSPDSVNSLKWGNLEIKACRETADYYRGLIAFRKAHAVLRLTDAAEVAERITAVKTRQAHLLAFRLQGKQRREELFAAFNAGKEPVELTLPRGKWTLYVSDSRAGTEPLETVQHRLTVPPIGAMILTRRKNRPGADKQQDGK